VGLAANPWVSRSSGLNIGFDKFYNIDEDRSLLQEVGWINALKFVLGVRRRGGGFTAQAVKHPSDWLMISLARQQLNELNTDNTPTFMYFHTKGVHKVDDDFYPPPAWKGRVTPNESYHDRYDDLLAWVDHQWPRLESAIDDDAIVVVTSDHGELLGEDDGYIGHNYDHPLLYEVPLWIRGLDTDQFDGEINHVEVMSAILSAVGLSTEPCDITPETDQNRELVSQAEHKLSALGYK
jgi:arylsulfatase A-like enzyme